MRRHIVINCEPLADESYIHRLRSFGEDLFRKFRSGDQAVVDLEEVDRAINRIPVL